MIYPGPFARSAHGNDGAFCAGIVGYGSFRDRFRKAEGIQD
jgi:hypothetical protein